MDENRDGLQPESKPDTEHRAGESCPGRRLEKGGGLRRLWQEYGFIPVTVAVMPLVWAKWASTTDRGLALFRKVSSKMCSTSPALSSLWLWSDTPLTL